MKTCARCGRTYLPPPPCFLVGLLLLREAQGTVGHIHWAIYAPLLGLGILGSALFFEKRGEWD